jgi:hypothetical protein
VDAAKESEKQEIVSDMKSPSTHRRKRYDRSNSKSPTIKNIRIEDASVVSAVKGMKDVDLIGNAAKELVSVASSVKTPLFKKKGNRLIGKSAEKKKPTRVEEATQNFEALKKSLMS